MFKKKDNSIKLAGEIDISMKPTEIRIQPTTGDVWIDFGYWLEATSFMAKQAMLAQDWSEIEMKKYIQDYMDKSISDYSVDN